MPLFYLFQNWYHLLHTPISSGESLPLTGSFISSVCFSSEMGRWAGGSALIISVHDHCRILQIQPLVSCWMEWIDLSALFPNILQVGAV